MRTAVPAMIASVVLSLSAAEPPARVSEGSFGIAASAETGGNHARLYPLLRDAGVTRVRSFPEWQGLQPAAGQWEWADADARVESARANGIRLYGIFAYLTPWASSGGTRTFPLKDPGAWEEYVRGLVTRYRDDIDCWEVYNEFNSPAFARNGTPKDYADLVRRAATSAKAADPDCRIGIGCASVAVSFLEQAIREGAAGHFDFVNVHPYELLEAAMNGREAGFLRLTSTIREMLRRCGERDDIGIWISEVGLTTDGTPESERRQADALIKVHVLSFCQGVEKVFWFEGRGPYNMDLLRPDWSKRPAYTALQTLTELLGTTVRPAGWLNPTGKSYGFMFEGPTQPVLVAWATGEAGDVVRFPAPVTVTDAGGTARPVAADTAIPLTREAAFITGLDPASVAEARANAARPFPWLGDFSAADSVSCMTGAENVENGIALLKWGDGGTVPVMTDGVHVRRSDRANRMFYIYFDVDDSYASVGDRPLEVTVTGRSAEPGKPVRFSICYESTDGYRNTTQTAEFPADDAWHEASFRLDDANFGNAWGWNLRIDVLHSPADILVKEVTVRKLPAPAQLPGRGDP